VQVRGLFSDPGPQSIRMILVTLVETYAPRVGQSVRDLKGFNGICAGHSPKPVECLIGADAEPLHENALRYADDRAASKRCPITGGHAPAL
jgi:hypothetical protein